MTHSFCMPLYGTRGRFERWMQANPHRARMITAISVIVGGTFLSAYWGMRLPANFGIGWFPHFKSGRTTVSMALQRPDLGHWVSQSL